MRFHYLDFVHALVEGMLYGFGIWDLGFAICIYMYTYIYIYMQIEKLVQG